MGRPLADCHHLVGGASEPAGRAAVNAVIFWGNHGETIGKMGKIMGKSMVNRWKMERSCGKMDGKWEIYEN